jgi:hypothetical protein
MTITIEIPDGQSGRVVNAFATVFGYRDKIQDPNNIDVITYIDNPQTKRQFAKQQIIEFVKRTVSSYEMEEAKKLISVSEIDAN